MEISSITPKIAATVGAGITEIGRAAQKKSSFASNINKFAEGRGINPGRGAFLALIFSCTLIPRFLKARDADERSEILRRDVTTILTITFAMKAIKAGLSDLMAKKKGLPMTFTNLPENASWYKKALGYFQQKGRTAFSAEDITANYANIDGKDSLTRMLNFVEENKGNVGKVLTFDRANPASLYANRRTDGALTLAARKLLGEDFDFTKPGKEIIAAIKAKDASNPAFAEISNILKDVDTNPIAQFAKGIGSKFETVALLAVVAFLGFGLPKLNEKLTKDKYFDKDGNGLNAHYANPNTAIPNMPNRSALSTFNQSQRMVFQNFLGAHNSSNSNQNAQKQTFRLNA